MTPAEKKALQNANDLQFEESIKELPENEQTLMRKVRKEVADAFAKQTEENRAETAKLLEDSLAQLKEQETIKTMAKILENQGLAIRRIEQKGEQMPSTTPKTLKESLQLAFAEKSDDIKRALDGQLKANEAIELKTNITETTTLIAGSYQNTLTENTGIISPIRRRAQKYLDAVTTGTVGNKYALWIEETTEEGTPIFIAEAAGKTQISVLYVEKRQDVQKIAVYSKVSTELLADLPQLISFIESSMMKRVAVKIESELYSGVGTTVYLKGATQWASAFSAGNAANTIPFANEIDVINAIANQVELAFGESNAIMVHPDTILKIKSLKSAQGEPLWKEYQDWSIAGGGTNLVIGGMRVISSPVVTSGEFLGGDMKVLRVLFREQMNIRMVASGDDPINNLMTLIVESRLVQFASANEVSALIKGDFATAIAALTSVA